MPKFCVLERDNAAKIIFQNIFTGSPTKEGPGSPTRSPSKSPRKGHRSKARDVLTLPKPYSHLKSDQIKRWNKEMIEGKVIGADNEAEKELFDSINFTNALVLKINQLAKQVNIFILVRFLSYVLTYLSV